jgi:hypothetical protein
MARSATQSMEDRAWNLIASLENCREITDVEKGTTSSAVVFSLDCIGIPPEVMETLADHDYYLAKGSDGIKHDWLAIYDGR